jgi:hypothetical protein
MGMVRQMIRKIGALMALAAFSLNANAISIEITDFDVGHTLLTFDELTDGTIVDDEYAALGVTVSGTSGNDGTGVSTDVGAYDTGGSYSDPMYIGQPDNDWWDGSVIFEFSGVSVTQFGGILVSSVGDWLSVYDTSGSLIETVYGDGSTYDFVGIDTGSTLIGKAIFSGDFYAVDDVRFNASVPEPASLILLGAGLLGLGASRGKRVFKR